MTVRAKFRCESVTKTKGWGGNNFLYAYEMKAVSADSEENKKFFAATPVGELKVSTVVADFFVPGTEYYLDFSEAE